jgi:sugar phosphate isomerase/epimerase
MSVPEIITLCSRARLQAVEWGGDVHVPHGNTSTARETAHLCREAGLEIAAYGSYYRVGETEDSLGFSFEQVLDSAEALGTKVIRVWPGLKGLSSADYSSAQRETVITDALRIGDLAQKRNLRLAYEYHGGTLTDTNESALQFIEETRHPVIGTFWQPPNGQSLDYCLSGLKKIIKKKVLENVHVFHWEGGAPETGPVQRKMLAAGQERWHKYIEQIQNAPGDRYLCLEFAKDNESENTLADAAILQQWLTA